MQSFKGGTISALQTQLLARNPGDLEVGDLEAKIQVIQLEVQVIMK
jgi:hypothetical protein